MSAKLFTYEEVAAHNKRNDLYMIIDKKVYDITKFLDQVSKKKTTAALLYTNTRIISILVVMRSCLMKVLKMPLLHLKMLVIHPTLVRFSRNTILETLTLM